MWHKREGLSIIIICSITALITHLVGLEWVLIALGVWTLGYIAGHLFWGKPYIPNQED